MNNLNSDHTADNKNVYSSHIVLRDPDIMLIHLACYFSALISIFWVGVDWLHINYSSQPFITPHFLPEFHVYLFSVRKYRNFILQIQKKKNEGWR